MLGDTAVAVNPDDERYKSYVGKTASPAAGGARDSDHRRRRDRSRIRHRRAENHAGARPGRLRAGQASQPRADLDDRQHRAHERERRRVSRAVARGRAQADRQGSRSRGPARKDRAAQARGRRMLAMRHASSSRCSPSSGSSACARWPIARSRRCARATRPSIPSSGRTSFSTGSKTSTTGVSRASYGGAIGFPPTDACDAII